MFSYNFSHNKVSLKTKTEQKNQKATTKQPPRFAAWILFLVQVSNLIKEQLVHPQDGTTKRTHLVLRVDWSFRL